MFKAAMVVDSNPREHTHEPHLLFECTASCFGYECMQKYINVNVNIAVIFVFGLHEAKIFLRHATA